MRKDLEDNGQHLLLRQQLCFALYRASRSVVRAYGPLLKSMDLTYPQYLVMLVLWEEDDLSVKTLGQKLDLDSATLTPLLKKLAIRKLVSRKRDSSDERSVKIELTAAGKSLKSLARCIPFQIAEKAGIKAKDTRGLAKLAHLREELTKFSDFLAHENSSAKDSR